MSLSPIKLPSPPPKEEPTQNDEAANQEKEEANLRRELMNLIASGSFKYSCKIIEKANLEQLKDIRMIYDRQRAKHLVKTLISWMAIIIAKGLYKIDCLGEHQVEPLTKSLTEDELLEQDMLWLLGKLIHQVPCPGIISAGGKVGFEVVKHKYGKKFKKVEKGVVSLVRETKEEIAKRRRSSLSSISSLSSEDES